MIDAAETIWVCEKGHADDHHFLNDGIQWCSRCGGRCLGVKLDGLARIAANALREADPDAFATKESAAEQKGGGS